MSRGLELASVWEEAGQGGAIWSILRSLGLAFGEAHLGSQKAALLLPFGGWLLLEPKTDYGLGKLWSWAGSSRLNLGSPVFPIGRLDLDCGEWVYPRLEGWFGREKDLPLVGRLFKGSSGHIRGLGLGMGASLDTLWSGLGILNWSLLEVAETE